MKLYDFGADFIGKKPESLKAIAWPVNAWACYIPDNVNPKLNILEKLILSLVDQGVANTKEDVKDILVKQLQLNEDLVDNVLDNCAKEYLNQSFKKELKLRVEAKKLLEAVEDGISPEMDMSDNTKKVFLFQESVTNTIVPCFNIENLPSDNDYLLIDDKNCVVLPDTYALQPKTADINNALRLWGRIFRNINAGETVAENNVDLSEEYSDAENDDDFGNDETPVKTLADVAEKPKRLDSITVFDDEPRKYMAKGYLAFNPDNPSEIEIISPFGNVLDNWFMKLVNKLRVLNKAFADELELFLMEKTETFKDSVAFGNDLDIQLFDDFPAICNDSKYKKLKRAITELSKDVERIRKGEDESINLAKNMRTAIEVMFRIVIAENPQIEKMKSDFQEIEKQKKGKSDKPGYRAYSFSIRQLVETNRLNSDIKPRYQNEGIFKNVISPYQSNTKDNAALILTYAQRNPSSPEMSFVKNYDYIFVEILDLINLGNDASHGGEKFAEMYFSKEDAERYYAQYENVVRALYTNLVGGEINV